MPAPSVCAPIPLKGLNKRTVSGTYVPCKKNYGMLPSVLQSAIFRFDVDKWYPQNIISCTLSADDKQTQLVYALTAKKNHTWTGSLLKQDGDANPVGAKCSVSLLSFTPHARPKIEFTTEEDITFVCKRVSDRFHNVTVEFDRVKKVGAVTSFSPRTHPQRPQSLPTERLNIKKVFNRAGFDVSYSPDRDVIPEDRAGKDRAWSNRELHDAMQTYWAFFSKKPQWSLWVFFATRYKGDAFTGGIMFDSKKKAQRRGVALFDQSMLFNAPFNDANPKMWERRIRFWTTCHEMGHLFNLAHVWEKETGTSWIPQQNNEASLSFMNYPHRFPDGKNAYFERFAYRFDDEELRFLRHAPPEFIQMGNCAFFTNHAFNGQRVADRRLSLQLRTQRISATYDFMEPVIIECKLKNISSTPVTLPFTANFLQERITLAITDKNGDIHHHRPFHKSDASPPPEELASGDSWFCWLFISADSEKWTICEPGSYSLQAFFISGEHHIASGPLQITVNNPVEKHSERLAQDFFNDEIARIFAFDGSTALSRGTDFLAGCLDTQLPETVKAHTRLALTLPLQSPSRKIVFSPDGTARMLQTAADPDKMVSGFNTLFFDNNRTTAETMGNIKFKELADNYTDWLETNGQNKEAIKCQQQLLETFQKRKIKHQVVSAIKKRLSRLSAPSAV